MKRKHLKVALMIAELNRNDCLSFFTPNGALVVIESVISGMVYTVKVNESVCGLWSYSGCVDYIRREVSSWD